MLAPSPSRAQWATHCEGEGPGAEAQGRSGDHHAQGAPDWGECDNFEGGAVCSSATCGAAEARVRAMWLVAVSPLLPSIHVLCAVAGALWECSC